MSKEAQDSVLGSRYARAARNERIQREQAQKEQDATYLRGRQPAVRHLTPDEIRKKVDAEGGVSNFGGTAAGKALGTAMDSIPLIQALRAGIGGVTYFTHAPKGAKFTDWMKQYYKNEAASSQDRANDMATNMQVNLNHVRRGAGDVGRFAAKWVDPRSWGTSAAAKRNREAHDTAWDNAQALTKERDRRIRENYVDKGLTDRDSGIGKWNGIMNEQAGELMGGTLATAGIGGGAKVLSKGVGVTTKAVGGLAGRATTGAINAAANSRVLSPVARGVGAATDKMRYMRSGMGATGRSLEASRMRHINALTAAGQDPSRVGALASRDSFRRAYVAGMRGGGEGARRWAAQAGQTYRGTMAQRAGDMVQKGVSSVGDVITAPLDAVGAFVSPQSLVKSVKSVGSPIQQTFRAGAQPFRDLSQLIRNPNARSAYAANWRYYPGHMLWRTATSPVRYAWNTIKPMGKAYLSRDGMRYDAARRAITDGFTGEGSAAAPIAEYAAWNGFGNLALPFTMMGGLSGGEEQ